MQSPDNQTKNPLADSVQFLKGIGPDRAKLLERLGVHTIEDLLFFIPRDYEDVQATQRASRIQSGRVTVVWGDLQHAESRVTRSGLPIVEAVFQTEDGVVVGVWFNRPSVADYFRLGKRYRLTGKPKMVDGFWKMTNPKVEGSASASGVEAAAQAQSGLRSVYPLTDGLHPDALRQGLRHAVDAYSHLLVDPIPGDLKRRYQLVDLAAAIKGVHFPETEQIKEQGRRRLAFDDLFVLQVALALKRASRVSAEGRRVATSAAIDRRIRRRLPFELTGAQNRVLRQVVADMSAQQPMNRLIQGDVGCGKTAVAVYAMLTTVANDMQAAMMAPTEVLARQHFRTIDHYLKDSRVRRQLLTGSLTPAERARALERIAAHEIDLVVGTQALIQKEVGFAALGLVVIDEQHKFGVRQRAEFQRYVPKPNYLVMTATPIPRSLAMTWFGDLDLSIIDEKPPGRRPVQTYVVGLSQRASAYDVLCRQVRMGGQGIVVCPRIDSEDTSSQTVSQVHRELAEGPLSDVEIGILHGRLDDVEKEQLVRRFESGQVRVIIATIVVEVGVDLPGASIILVEGAERFGLSQLHQIRGRVGRGEQRGQCWLINGVPYDDAVRERLNELAATNDGFEVADIDARMRGVGEVIGDKQHGFIRFRVADLLRDGKVLAVAREEARRLVDRDPSLKGDEVGELRRQVVERYGSALKLALVG